MGSVPPVSGGGSLPPLSGAPITPVKTVIDSLSTSSSTGSSADISPVGILEGQITMGGLMDIINGVMHAAQRNTRDMVQQEILRAKSFFDIAARNAGQISDAYENRLAQFKADTIISASEGEAARDLNDKITALNSAAATQNSKHSPSSMSDYNDAVDDYHRAVLAYNAKITSANALIDNSGENLPHQSFQPFGGVTRLTNQNQTASTVSRRAIDPSTLKQSDYVSETMTTNNTAGLDLFATFSKLVNQSLNESLADDSQRIKGPTRATTFIPISSTTNLRPETLEDSDVSTQQLGILSSAFDSWLSKGLYAKTFENILSTPPDKVLEQLRTLSLGIILQSALSSTLPGAALILRDINESPSSVSPNNALNAGGIAISTTLTARLIGLLSSNQLLPTIGGLVGSSPSLSTLTENEKSELTRNLTALITSSLLLTAVGALANELKNPAVFGALTVANTVASPTASAMQFPQIQQTFQAAVQQYGALPVATLFSQFLGPILRPQGLPNLADTIAQGLVTNNNGFQTAAAFSASVTAQATAAGKTPAEASQIANEALKSAYIFSASVNLRSSIQDSLIHAIGPQLAPSLSDEITRLLTGLSVDFHNSRISTAGTQSRSTPSVLSLVSDQQVVLANQDKANTQQLQDNRQEASALSKFNSDRFADSQKVNTDLGAFLQAILSPGKQLFGLMYAGVQQRAKTKGKVGIPEDEPSGGLNVA